MDVKAALLRKSAGQLYVSVVKGKKFVGDGVPTDCTINGVCRAARGLAAVLFPKERIATSALWGLLAMTFFTVTDSEQNLQF